MDEGFSVYSDREGGYSSEVQEIIMPFVVLCDYEASIPAAKSMTYIEGQRASATFFWRLGAD